MDKRTVQKAYSQSKSIVVNELDAKDFGSYDRMNYVEFLEFISRCSDFWFAGTEMKDYPLWRKIEYFVERMFLYLSDARLTRQQIVVEEFSDIDSDY